MVKKVFVLSIMLMVIGGSLFAVAPGSWVNASLGYEKSDSSGALGLDVSWLGFPGHSWIGAETRAGVSLSLDSTSSYLKMYAFVGPALSVDFTEGILGYMAVGPTYAFTAYDSPSALMHSFGIGLDLGARFRILGSEEFDLALIAGAYGDAALYFSMFSQNGGGSSYRVSAYVGLSVGSGFYIPQRGLVSSILFT